MAAKEALQAGGRPSDYPAHSGGATRSAQGYGKCKARQVYIQNVQYERLRSGDYTLVLIKIQHCLIFFHFYFL